MTEFHLDQRDQLLLNTIAAVSTRIVLRNSVAEVTFTKADGSTRVIVGTTHPDLIPLKDENEPYDISMADNGSSRVHIYEIEKKQWRSFLVDRVSDFKVIEDLWEGGEGDSE